MPADYTKPVSPDDMVRYLAAHNPRPACRCGSLHVDFWDEPGESTRYVLVHSPFGNQDIAGMRTADVIYGECAKCHELRFYNRKAIMAWLAANPA